MSLLFAATSLIIALSFLYVNCFFLFFQLFSTLSLSVLLIAIFFCINYNDDDARVKRSSFNHAGVLTARRRGTGNQKKSSVTLGKCPAGHRMQFLSPMPRNRRGDRKHRGTGSQKKSSVPSTTVQ